MAMGLTLKTPRLWRAYVLIEGWNPQGNNGAGKMERCESVAGPYTTRGPARANANRLRKRYMSWYNFNPEDLKTDICVIQSTELDWKNE